MTPITFDLESQEMDQAIESRLGGDAWWHVFGICEGQVDIAVAGFRGAIAHAEVRTDA